MTRKECMWSRQSAAKKPSWAAFTFFNRPQQISLSALESNLPGSWDTFVIVIFLKEPSAQHFLNATTILILPLLLSMKSPHLHSISEFYYVNTNPIVSTLSTAITTTIIHNVPAVFSTFSLAAFFCSGMCEPSDPLYRPHLSSITLHYLSQFTLSLTFHSIIFRIALTFTIAFMIF